MITVSEIPPDDVKKLHCPVCGGRLCDVQKNETVCLENEKNINGIVLKCYKCGNKINISIH